MVASVLDDTRRGTQVFMTDARPAAPATFGGWVPDELRRKLYSYSPRTELGRIVRECFRHLPADLAGELLDLVTSCVVLESRLWGVHILADGRRLDLGLLSYKVVTDAGVGFIVDAFQNTTELENMKFHGLGTGGTAEAAGQTALITELTTEYNPNSTRATGSTTEGAGANVYRTVGTNTVDATAAVTEHGIFSAASAGVMLDRSLFSVVNLANGDSLQTTYDLTISSGG